MDALRANLQAPRSLIRLIARRPIAFLPVIFMFVLASACGGGQAAAPASPTGQPTAAAAAAQPAQPTAAQAVQPAATAAVPQSQPTSGEIAIGMNVGITGQFASEGDLYVKAVRLAEKQINDAGGVNGKKIKVIIQDNQSTNPGALATLNKNVEQDKVLALIGPVKSTQILAMSDAIKSYGIPTMVGGTNASITQAGNPWLFRCRVSDSIAESVMVRYVKDDMKLTKIGTLFSAEAFGTGAADLVDQYAKENGLTVVARKGFTPGDRDFTAQLLAIKAAGAEVLLPLSAGHEEHAAINRQYKQLGAPYKYISTPAIAMKDVLSLSGDAAEGLMGVVEAMQGQSDANSKYIADYKKAYNENADMVGAWTYDALNVLANAIKKGGEDRNKIKDAILATQGFEGVEGTFSFDKYGDGLHQMYVAIIQNGEPKMVKVVKVDQ